jgi:hypothetical protein
MREIVEAALKVKKEWDALEAMKQDFVKARDRAQALQTDIQAQQVLVDQAVAGLKALM